MKKLMLTLAAAFAMVACQTDINEVGVAGGEVNVTFEVGTPTRAYSDGKTATRLQYAIYDETGARLTAHTKTNETINITATVELKLVTGNSYTAIFWASEEDAPYTVDFDAKTMTVNYNGVACNDENLDAFYAKHEFTVKGAQTETIELKRPFAQLNIGTNDYTKATEAGYTPEYSAVTVKNIYSTLNLWDATVDGETEVDFGYAAIAKTETFPVDGYEYLAMNYLLVPADKHVVDIEFGYGESSTAAEKTRIVGSVPVQRNHRTNIYGQLLTSDVDINVVIKPAYDEPAYELDALHKAALNGGEITLTEDVVLTTPLEVVGKMTINLNGKTITTTEQSAGRHHYAIDNYATLVIEGEGAIDARGIENFGTLIINGNVTITNIDTNGGAAIWNEGKVTINNGTFTTNASAGVGSYGAALNTRPGGEAIVNGGTFVANSQLTYAIINEGKTIINNATVKGKHGAVAGAVSGDQTTINGGSFELMENRSVSDHCVYYVSSIKGGKFSLGNNTDSGAQVFYASTIANGYKAIKNGDLYYVVADTVDAVVSDAAELQAALAAGGEVVLTGDVTYSASITNDAVVNLNGNSFLPAGTINLNNNADLTMVGGDYVVNGTYGHVDVRPSTADGSVVVYENVHFTSNYINKTFGNSTDRLNSVVEICAAATDAKTVIKFKNCTFDNGKVLIEGMSGKTGSVEAVFEGCTFNALTNSSPIDVMNYVTATIEVKDCTFNLECTSGVASAIDVSPSSSTSVVLIATNNTFNAVAATPYTYDASKGETEAHNIKVNGTPANIKFISAYDNTTVTETGTVKSGIAKL